MSGPSSLLQTAVSTALPTIINALNGDDFVWVSTAYSLAATSLLPATGGMAQVRRNFWLYLTLSD